MDKKTKDTLDYPKCHKCCICGKQNAILQLDNGEWECENCAQIMAELAP